MTLTCPILLRKKHGNALRRTHILAGLQGADEDGLGTKDTQ